MNKADLLRKLETLIDEAVRTQLCGTIGISFSAGVPVILRQETTTRIDSLKAATERNHAKKTYR